jgi:acetylglutamate kinase
MAKVVLMNAAKALAREHGFDTLQLREAIPYMREFQDKTMVVKVGGSVLEDANSQLTFLEDVVFMATIGIRVILVHGGSRQLSAAMKKMGLEPVVRDGERYTDAVTLELAKAEFNKLNSQLVNSIRKLGGLAVGFPASEGTFVRARRKGQDPLNFVGVVTGVDDSSLNSLKEGSIPVITCIGRSDTDFFNINADEVAAELAVAVKAEKLILLTDVDGVKDANGNLFSTLTRDEVERLLADGIIRGGMVPKVSVCLDALKHGVHKTHIVNGEVEGSLLCEVLSDAGAGTEIVAKQSMVAAPDRMKL